jgi:hypothetical protein
MDDSTDKVGEVRAFMDRKNSVQEYPLAIHAAFWLLRHQDKVKETLLRVCAQKHGTNYIDWKSMPFPARQNPLGKSDFTTGESRFYAQPNRTVCVESSEGLMRRRPRDWKYTCKHQRLQPYCYLFADLVQQEGNSNTTTILLDSVRHHPRRFQPPLAQDGLSEGERLVIRRIALVLPDPRDGIVAGHIPLLERLLLQRQLRGRDPVGGLVTGVDGHPGSALFGSGSPVTGTGVPEDDVARSEVWVDDGRAVGFEPVDVFVGVLEVVSAEAFLRRSEEVIISAVSDSGPL